MSSVHDVSNVVGTATEFITGERKTTVCYGTYNGDMFDQSFRFRISFVEHNDEFQMHSHEYSELVIVLAGRAIHLTDVESHPLQTGDVVVINAGRSHGFAEAKGLQLCNIMYDPQQFLSGERELESLMGYRALFELGPRSTLPTSFSERIHLAIPELAQLNSMLSPLKHEYEKKDPGWKASVRYQFLALVTFLSRTYTAQKSKEATPMLQMARVVSHIQQNYHSQVSVAELAKLAHLSSSQFQRRFKQIYNTSPMQYVTNVRIHAASDMLKDPNRGIAEIARAAGFSTSAFFCETFKRHIGETPTAYRRRFVQIAAENTDA